MAERLEVDMIVRAIEQGFDNVIKDLNKVDGVMDDVDEGAQSAGLSLTDIKSGIDLVVGGLRQVEKVGRVAFEWGAQGAQATQTAESFDLLLDKVDAAPDLLEELRRASRGTISDLELMQGTSLLLAGTSGTLATQLANATPELLEIAKAAQKLNPSLGDTAFLYDSISRGIKRASPLILDNLGLMVSVGDANERYADQVGKTVDELTAEEEKLALLNETLRAGGALIDQVGGSTESATDSFEQFTAEWANLTNELKQAFAPAATEAVVALTDMVSAQRDLFEATQRGTGDTHDWAAAIIKAIFYGETWASVGADAAKEVDRLDWAETQNVETKKDWVAITRDGARQAQDSVEVLKDWNTVAGRTKDEAEQAASGVEQLGSSFRGVDKAAGDATKTAAQLLDSMDRKIDSPIGNFIEDLDFMIAGGGEIQNTWDRIKEAWQNNELTPEEARELAAGLYTITQDFNEELGNIDPDEAAQNISEKLGIPLEDAKEIIAGSDGINEALAALDVPNSYLDEIEEARARTDEILSNLLEMQKSWNVDININVNGGIPNLDGLDGGGGGPNNQGFGGGVNNYNNINIYDQAAGVGALADLNADRRGRVGQDMR